MVSEFGRVCMHKKKARVNVVRSLSYGFSMDVNVGRMDAILNDYPLEKIDCFKYFGSQVWVDGESEKNVVHRMND